MQNIRSYILKNWEWKWKGKCSINNNIHCVIEKERKLLDEKYKIFFSHKQGVEVEGKM
jgi:hypothetical protein